MKVFEFDKIPIVEIVNEILLDGVKKGASDIHFDPSKEYITIRMRVDGVLHDYATVPMEFKRNMISRVKMIASMNIMETRLPQDGAIKSKIGDKMLDLRVSSLPTNCGEKVVLRILDYSKSLQGLETLGFSEENLNKIFKMVAVPNGIVLVTGATGSGKSTTVYSILQRLNTREVNIITVEDPVEMDVEGLNQVQAQQEIGLDFANVLRSILRQDPDIIMIGEIRDTETAQIAVRASITGHKVLSTIHTNSALNTIERLIDMGVERYLIGTSLSGVISQKLARKLCPNCKVERDASDYEKRLVKEVLHKDITRVYDANPDGCDKCTRGYKNRVAIAEVLFINDDVRTGITNSVSKDVMRKLVYGHGNTHTLLQDGLDKVVEGETSFDEILKLSDLENDLAITKELEEEGLNDFSAGEQFRNKDGKNKKDKNNKHSGIDELIRESERADLTIPGIAAGAATANNQNKKEDKKEENEPQEEPQIEFINTQPQQPVPQAQPVPVQQPVQEVITTPVVQNVQDVLISPDSLMANAGQSQQQPMPQPQPVPQQAPAPQPVPQQQAAQTETLTVPTATPNANAAPAGLLFETPITDAPTEKIELSAVIPPNNSAAAVNLNTGEIPKNLEMFQ